jgi:hypothetical protein
MIMCSGMDLEDNGEREHRSPRMLRCEVIDPVGRRHNCLVRNISRWGLGGSGTNGLATGQRVTVVLPELATLTGAVRWAGGGKFGILLDQEVVPELVRFVGEKNSAAPNWQVNERWEPTAEWRGPRC